ncbi:hypothetical protein [Gramella sp. KN1008]|nr:hypothetical protein [Gramella sp. KN1008]
MMKLAVLLYTESKKDLKTIRNRTEQKILIVSIILASLSLAAFALAQL